MKRILSVVLLLALLLCGCGGKGNVSDVQMSIGPSKLYGEGEIKAAMEVVVDFFEKDFDHCTLYELSYDEEFSSRFADAEAAHYNADDAIVLKSVFEVGSEGSNGSLEPGSTHYYTWTLTRAGDGTWTLRNWGYA